MARVGRSVSVRGRVQGVFFRAWLREQAEALNLSGWVRNCADGSVAANISGEEAAVEQMIALLHRGPPSAAVDEVDAIEAVPDESGHFEVRH